VPFQEAPSPPMTPELLASCETAIHVVTSNNRTLRAGRATLFILANIGYGWLARPLMLPPFVWLAELGYRIVAANRPFFARFLFKRE
jgi:predicted DCC family thiol-disulfide oxidoreductase YuxK